MICGAVFDLDGTLLDSNPYWDMAPAAFLTTLGKRAKPDLARTIFSMTLSEAAEFMIQEYALSQTPEEIADGVNAAMERFYRKDTPLKPGVPDLLDALRGRGIPCAVASVTDKPLVEAALLRHGVLSRFKSIVTTTEAGAGKHEPEVYIRAARSVGSGVSETIVFEDAFHAIRTAKRAGFITAGVYDAASADMQREIREICDFYVEDFSNTGAILDFIDNQKGTAV